MQRGWGWFTLRGRGEPGIIIVTGAGTACCPYTRYGPLSPPPVSSSSNHPPLWSHHVSGCLWCAFLTHFIHFSWAALFAAGFTALCENYCSEARSKHDGTDQLTSTLNQYLSHIVQGRERFRIIDAANLESLLLQQFLKQKVTLSSLLGTHSLRSGSAVSLLRLALCTMSCSRAS